ncbi:hypothetical protein FRC10_002004 [Ceratobasidium sp. 414]|nr:hypothetical protein FRC10_002004 [Ceratobasidium sp. 414]
MLGYTKVAADEQFIVIRHPTLTNGANSSRAPPTMSYDSICKHSLLPFSTHDEDVLRVLAMPVTDQMLQHVALKLTAALGTPGHQQLPTPPVTPVRGKFVPDNVTCAPEWDFPPLEKFLADLIYNSDVHTASVLGSMIYLQRITRALQSDSIKHGPETPYRLAAALFIIASKYNHDSSPSTVHWTCCVACALGVDSSASLDMLRFYEARRATKRGGRKAPVIEGEEPYVPDKYSPTDSTSLGYMFGPEATAALERDLLHLLDYNLRFSEDELRDCLNSLSSHPRASGPVEELRLGHGRPSREFVQHNRHAYTMAMRRTISPLKAALGSAPSHDPLTPSSQPHTPLRKLKSSAGRIKLTLEVKTGSARYPNPWSCAPYPQLNPSMGVNYLSKLINGSKFRNPFPPLGVPAAPPSTPAAGIGSLPFIYGGRTQPPTPVSGPALPGLIVPPDENSPWAHGQVGEILRKTMERQAEQLAAVAANPPRGLKLLNTPPPVPAFGSGILYLHDSKRSSVEPGLPSKPSAWGCTLGEPSLSASSRGGFKEAVEKWTKARKEKNDGMPAGGQKDHPALLSPAPSPTGHCPPHFQGTVESGPMELLNTRWDRLQAWLAANGQAEPEEAYQTTRPLRIGDKRQRECGVIPRRGESSAQSPIAGPGHWEMGVSYVPAPSVTPQQRPTDCDSVIVGKFFPADGLDRKQQVLCERDYFARLNLVCIRCEGALRESYITAGDKKYHPEHFTCSICPTLFGPQDSYYEYDGDVFCHWHYSTRFATKCAGCNSAVLKEFVDCGDGIFHPKCYMIFKSWGIKVLQAGDAAPTRPTYEIEECQATPESLKAAQAKTEARVRTIWVNLNAFEESSAFCVRDMLAAWRAGDCRTTIRIAEEFVLLVQGLFTIADEMRNKAITLSMAEEDLESDVVPRLVTRLGYQLKNLIKTTVTAALELNDDSDALEKFLGGLKTLTANDGSAKSRVVADGHQSPRVNTLVEKNGSTIGVEDASRMKEYVYLLDVALARLSWLLDSNSCEYYDLLAFAFLLIDNQLCTQQ